MKVYQAINAVQKSLSKSGISKDQKNLQQGYKFRGIDDVYNAVSPLLAEHGLCILPRMLARVCEERVNQKGTALFYVTVEAEFDLVASEDGSSHTIKTFGEAMDSGDKATNKAMSAAYKYAIMQCFAIPTEGDNDADLHAHEAVKKQEPAKSIGMTPKGLADLMAKMDEADTIEKLKEEYANAYKLAKIAGDVESMGKFEVHYKRLKERVAA